MTRGSKKFNYKHYIRRAHRYLGVFIGVQFILWTIGGLYFSWTNLDEIHGDHLRAHAHTDLRLPAESVSPSVAASRIRSTLGEVQIEKMYLVELFGNYFYAVERSENGKKSTLLARVEDGSIRPAVSAPEAAAIAQNALANPGEPREIRHLTIATVSSDHEYREKPLPAWAVDFDRDVTVYLSAETGQVAAVRTQKWRIFDFLWMLHTMDFAGRDNINNYVLRGFSVLGLVTVMSGFALFLVSSKSLRRFIRRR